MCGSNSIEYWNIDLLNYSIIEFFELFISLMLLIAAMVHICCCTRLYTHAAI